jgi:peptidyl-tRNA hydrolase
LKLGVGNDARYDLADWVLSKFSSEEQKELPKIFEKTRELLEEKIK